jgi:hypothetical protein
MLDIQATAGGEGRGRQYEGHLTGTQAVAFNITTLYGLPLR